ncbi:MAG: 2-dehydropantoate 2-reductase [Clostridiales bacterium]|nr:2-dehydropantoate 2-reductase [Clostridiales bacterium]
MKYLIIGAGGTGGCIGAYLAENGSDVTFIARGKQLDAIKNKGITIERFSGSFTVPVNVSTAEDYNDKPDAVFVCVKYYSLESIMPLLKRVCGSKTVVIPILNVFGTGGVIQKDLPGITVLDGCIYIYSFIKEPGVISLPSEDLIFRIHFGYRQGEDKPNYDKTLQIEKELNAAGIEAYFEPVIERETLLKFSLISPLGAALVYHNGRVVRCKKKRQPRKRHLRSAYK